MHYKISAAILNRKKSVGRMNDGNRLFWRRNSNKSLTAWQRVKTLEGKIKDIKLKTLFGAITAGEVNSIRQEGLKIKDQALSPEPKKIIKNYTPLTSDSTFGEAWDEFSRVIINSNNSRWSAGTIKHNVSRIDLHVKPYEFWDMPVNKISVVDIVNLLSELRQTKPNTESKVRGIISKVFSHLISLRKLDVNPVSSVADLYRNLEKVRKVNHLPAELEIQSLGKILKANEVSNSFFNVRMATFLQAYTCQRSSEIVEATWSEIDLDKGTWTIPRIRMKVKDRDYDQLIILPGQVITLLKSIPRAESEYVFPGDTIGHISRDALSKHLRKSLKMRGTHTPHGWRAALKTSATKATDKEGRPLFATDWIETCLDHDEKSKVEKAYLRERSFEGAGRVFQWWADQLDWARSS